MRKIVRRKAAAIVRVGLALAVAMSIAGLVVGPARAQDASGANATVLRLGQPTRTNVRGRYVLSATLIGPGGKLVADREVSFYRHVDLMGPRDALLGSATTDSSGTAVLAYEPAVAGSQVLSARFAGAEGLPKAEASLVANVDDVFASYEQEPLPFASLRPWVLYLVTGAVVGVWVVLLTVLGTALSRIWALGAQEPAPEPSLAPAGADLVAVDAR